MRGYRKGLCLLTAFLLLPMLSGCWNYREIDRMAIVAGVAVDRGEAAKYKVTLDLIKVGQGSDVGPKSKIISSEGESVFDAVRNAIGVAGKRLYWSHAKVIIISQEVAKDGVVKILDWYTRDSETRADVRLLISREKTAGEIFTESGENGDVKSVTMHEIFKNEKSLSKAPDIEIWRFINKLSSPGCSPIAAAVNLKDEGDKKIPEISGTAVFMQDEFIGFLDGEETFDMQMLQDKVRSGVIVHKEQGQEGELVISLEIFQNKTKIEPVIDPENNVSITVRIKTDAAIDEIQGVENYIEDTQREKLEKNVEEALKKDLEDHIRYVQSDFGTDIFCFGSKIYLDDPKAWNSISEKWPELFRTLNVNVMCDMHIRNSAKNSKTVQAGD